MNHMLLRPTTRRSGITLLEVLISIFVLAFGLLGVAALIPVGRFAIVEVGKADRSAVCGRAGLHEIKIRQFPDVNDGTLRPMTDIRTWRDHSGTEVLSSADTAAQRLAKRRLAYAIDPLFVAQNSNACEYFPYIVTNASPAVIRSAAMRRVTFSQYDTFGKLQQIEQPLAERIFMLQDQVLFDVPDDRDQRPRELRLLHTGVVEPRPFLLGDDSDGLGNDLLTEVRGDYTWLATVVPVLSNGNPTGTYTVSIVVFYKRDFTHDALAIKPSERFVDAELLGGGDVKLKVSNGPSVPNPKDPPQLDVRRNEWLLLSSDIPAGGTFRWYRVVAIDDEAEEESSGNWVRYATLAGPDWPANEAYATLIDGVVGVYTTTIDLGDQK